MNPNAPLSIQPSSSEVISCNVDWDKVYSSQDICTITIHSNDSDEPVVNVQVTAIPEDYTPPPPPDADIYLTIPDTEASSGSTVNIPIIAESGFKDVAIIELHIGFDNDLLTYSGMSSDYGLTSSDVSLSDDQITIVWVYSGSMMNVPDAGSLITLEFQVNNNASQGESCNIEFTGSNNIGDVNENPYELDLSNGIFTVSSGHSISGKILYCATESPLINNKIILSGDDNKTVYTNSTGEYLFETIVGNLLVTPQKPGDTNGAINGFDLLRLKNYLLGTTELSEYARLSSDCNGDKSVNGFDLLRLKNYILGTQVGAPMGEWVFSPAKYSYSPLNSKKINQDFKSYIIGDVNLNWLSSNASLAKSDNSGEVKFSDCYYDNDKNIHVSVKSDQNLALGMLDWCIDYDTTLFDFKALESRFLKLGDYQVREGQIQIVWIYSGKEEEFACDQTICTLVLKPKETLYSGKISFVGDNHLSKGNEAPYKLEYKDIEIDLSVLSKFEERQVPTETCLYSNYPNPFNPTTTISYYVKKISDVEIKIYNIRGELQKSYSYKNQAPGFYQVEWNTTEASGIALPSGIYFYRLCCNDKVFTKRMLLIK